MNVLLLLTVWEGLSASTLQKIQATSANVHLVSLEMAELVEMVVLVRYRYTILKYRMESYKGEWE